ncbi:Charged multivesicular body protein 2b [Eumeta japonica]|uniref:Charged multivesicular body protein 2b n=1 Tax=Eumeta variegata TaxID=151549 RepID=A0A4C1U7S0_EUMVA|nr:Charged multivesicular body protein 2b [Eumeta japonica]
MFYVQIKQNRLSVVPETTATAESEDRFTLEGFTTIHKRRDQDHIMDSQVRKRAWLSRSRLAYHEKSIINFIYHLLQFVRRRRKDYLVTGVQEKFDKQQRANDRELRKASRDLERDKNALEREEKKLEMEIKKMAKEGNNDGCKILAKQLVQLRKQKNRVHTANSKISNVSLHNKAMSANIAIAGAMGTTAKTMGSMNKLMDPQQIAKDMDAFKQASTKMDMTDEMISESLDDIMDESGDEEETEGIVNQVLDEIGIEISGKMANAPSAVRGKVGESTSDADRDIMAQLAKLRS